MARRVLFLCTGNLCRSPMALYLLRARLKDLGVTDVLAASSGFVASEGSPPCPVATATMASAGVDMKGHKARMTTRAFLERADIVLAMEKRHLGLAMDMAPGSIKKMALFAKYLPGRENMDVPDPYGKRPEDYRNTMELIREGVENLVKELAETAPEESAAASLDNQGRGSMNGWKMLTIIGEDRPGIVAAVTQLLYERGMNLGEASMLRLGGSFTIMLMAQGQPTAGELEKILQPLADSMGLRVHADAIQGKLHSHLEPNARITLFGADKAGIVAKATGALAKAGFNITLLETDVGGSQEAPIYIMQMEGVAAQGLGPVKSALAGMAEDGIEISVEPIDTLIG